MAAVVDSPAAPAPTVLLQELFEHDMAALGERLSALITSMETLRASERLGDKEAVEKALTAAKEITVVHNGLIRKMEVLVETFMSKESLGLITEAIGLRVGRVESIQSKMIGGLTVLAFIGVINLVKTFTS